MGVVPNLFLRPIEPSAARMVRQVQAQAPARIQARVDQSAVGSRQSAVVVSTQPPATRLRPENSPGFGGAGQRSENSRSFGAAGQRPATSPQPPR